MFFKRDWKKGIPKALKDGCLIHGFRSGGGLRVICISKGNKDKGYGEHPDVMDALKHAAEDYLAGHRSYKYVYGKKYVHYLTGSSTPSCTLDEMLLRGYSFDCTQKGEEVIFVLKAWVHAEAPPEAKELAKKAGKPVYYKTDRGFYMSFEYSRRLFPNGDEGWSSMPIFAPKGERGHHGWDYEGRFAGVGKDLMSAFEAAHKLYQIPPKTEMVTLEQLKELGIDPSTHSDEKLRQEGIDPVTMKPIKKDDN